MGSWCVCYTCGLKVTGSNKQGTSVSATSTGLDMEFPVVPLCWPAKHFEFQIFILEM